MKWHYCVTAVKGNKFTLHFIKRYKQQHISSFYIQKCLICIIMGSNQIRVKPYQHKQYNNDDKQKLCQWFEKK
mgnify:FL=1